MVGMSGASIKVIEIASPVTLGILAASRHAASHPAVPPPTMTIRLTGLAIKSVSGLPSTASRPGCRPRAVDNLARERGELNLSRRVLVPALAAAEPAAPGRSPSPGSPNRPGTSASAEVEAAAAVAAQPAAVAASEGDHHRS